MPVFSFLAVQDSPIGDIVSQSLSQTFDFSDFRALQSTAEQSRAITTITTITTVSTITTETETAIYI